MGEQRSDERLARLAERALLREHQFTSRVPLVGGMIAGLRSAWNNISTRWYVLPLIQQQSELNQSIVEHLADLTARLDRQAEQLHALQDELTNALHGELASLQDWLISQDREQTELRHDLGELAVLVGQLARLHQEAESGPNRPRRTDSDDGSA